MTQLQKTILAEWHEKQGAKMVEFAGFYMPVQYPLGVLKEHLHTRNKAGLFDVSHMGQIEVSSKDGADVAAILESVFPADLIGLEVGKQCYSLLLNDDGGVVDDLMICRRSDDFLLVVNAGCKDNDFAYLNELLSDKLNLVMREDKALLALQGPQSERVLNALGADVSAMTFMQGASIDVGRVHCWATRSGYTGEDGFELSVASNNAEDLANKLLSHKDVEAIGLGARDSLRLESGLCLYGHELSEDLSPIDASLNWAIAKVRRKGGSRAGGFIASDVILDQIELGSKKQRVGLVGEGKVPVREGAELFNNNDELLGFVSSGGYGPAIEKPVAMASVKRGSVAIGDTVFAQVRKKRVPMRVVKTPFIQQGYKR